MFSLIGNVIVMGVAFLVLKRDAALLRAENERLTMRASRLRDALMFKIADAPHADGCPAAANCEDDELPGECDCWRREAWEAIDEAKDADLMTRMRDLQDQVDGGDCPFGDA